MSTLETPRLRLRRLTLADLPHMLELETDPEVIKFTPLRFPISADQVENRLRNFIDKQPAAEPFGIWAAELKEGSDFIGWFMLLEKRRELPELGFMSVRRRWGQGLTTEAAKALLDYAFNDLNLPAVLALTDKDNTASKSVLKKLGFQFSKAIWEYDKILQRGIALEVFEIRRQQF